MSAYTCTMADPGELLVGDMWLVDLPPIGSSVFKTSHVRWNRSNPDTLDQTGSVLINKVS